jgi:DNA-binding NarL/FixJ family response regulator
VVLMDLAMPGVTGLEATRRLLAARPDMRVVILTGTVTVSSVCEAWEVGARGYLLKGENPDELPTLVRAVAAGDAVWSPAAAAHLAHCN